MGRRRTAEERQAILEQIAEEGWTLDEAVRKLRIPKGTLASWRHRAAEEEDEGGLQGLQTQAPSLQTDASSRQDTVKKSRAKKLEPTRGLTGQQADACRKRVMEGKSIARTARELGVAWETVSGWEVLPDWRRYSELLKAEMHEATVLAHKQAAALGAELRVRTLLQAAKLLESAEEGAVPMQAQVLKDIGATVERLTGSAEDRAGYPKTERVEHSGSVTHNLSAHDDETLDEEVERLRAELRVIEGGAA